ncbi:MAG: general secretion pathway protein GspK [Pirellulaceae bacterium]|nr:general secretion pathway protein GspK [Pirellulaceae bacterium]
MNRSSTTVQGVKCAWTRVGHRRQATLRRRSFSTQLQWLTRRRFSRSRPAFLLVLVTMVIVLATLAMLNFSRAMLISNETAHISGGQLQSRMCAESGAQAARLFLSYPHAQRLALGGTWNNFSFQARNVLPDASPQRRGNYSLVAPALDDDGSYSGLRYGLQNESAKLNLNMVLHLEQVLESVGYGRFDTEAMDAEGLASLGLSSSRSPAGGLGVSAAVAMLRSLPGMTADIADAILDWLDSDDEVRTSGAEADYYATLQPAYQPANGPLESIEQLLLVRGVTPQLLYGYDENRNGVLDFGEQQMMSLGRQPGALPGQINAAALSPDYIPPPPLGLAAYLTLHSEERNTTQDGQPRINLNSSDLQQLYTDLSDALGNETWASFIVAYRLSGSPPTTAKSPLQTLASMSTGIPLEEDQAETGDAAAELAAAADQLTPTSTWTVENLSNFDLSSQGQVQIRQVLDLLIGLVRSGDGSNRQIYQSPFGTEPSQWSESLPILMDKLTTIENPTIQGRLNIMECPRELLRCLPGFDDDLVNQVLAARSDGSNSPSRQFETWLLEEGYLTIDQMRALHPLITCSGDVFRAQVVGYIEGTASFSRIETVINAAGQTPELRFFRRMDHLGRGFSIDVLGRRPDAALTTGMFAR